MSAYLQRTVPGRHRGKRAAPRAGHTLSAASSWPYLASRHLAGLVVSAVLLACAVSLSVWTVL